MFEYNFMAYIDVNIDENSCIFRHGLLRAQRIFALRSFHFLACVASVSVLFLSKERPRNEILGFGRARNETRGKKMKEGGGGGEGRKRLQTNPSILKTCVRQRTQRLIGSAT